MSSFCPGVRRLLLVLALTGGLVSTAAAQSTVHLRGNVGASFFQSPGIEQDLLNSGTDLGLGVDVRVYRGVSLVLQGTYDQFTLNQEYAQTLSSTGLFRRAGDLSLLGGSIGVRYTLQNDSDAHPYVLAGIGVYHGRQIDSRFYGGGGGEPAATKTSSQRGFHLALGSNFRLDDTYAVFIEPRFTFVEGKSNGFLISTQDTETPRYFTLRVGVDVRLW